jgi:hypothetical protein
MQLLERVLDTSGVGLAISLKCISQILLGFLIILPQLLKFASILRILGLHVGALFFRQFQPAGDGVHFILTGRPQSSHDTEPALSLFRLLGQRLDAKARQQEKTQHHDRELSHVRVPPWISEAHKFCSHFSKAGTRSQGKGIDVEQEGFLEKASETPLAILTKMKRSAGL